MNKLMIFIFLVFLSCSLFKKEEEVMPLAVDNWWAYQVTEQRQPMPKELKGFIFERLSKSPATYIDTLKIIGKQTIEEVDGYIVFSSYKNDTIGIYYYKNDYLWLNYNFFGVFLVHEKVFPEKPKIGENWIGFEEKKKTEDWDFDGIEDSLQMKSEYSIIMKENINVLAGNFKDCYRTQMTITISVWTSTNNQWQTRMVLSGNLWIKPGIGLIKQDIAGLATRELTAYKVK